MRHEKVDQIIDMLKSGEINEINECDFTEEEIAYIMSAKIDNFYKHMTIKDKIVGSILGLCVGDALGVPVEFNNRE